MKVGITASLVVACAWVGIGCASLRSPDEAISAAEISVRMADDSLASKYAPLELVKAREKLEQSKRAVAKEEFEDARRLAEQALVDATLAEEKARTAKAKQTANEMRASVQALKEETRRHVPISD